MSNLSIDDKRFLREVVGNAEFQRIFTLLVEVEKAEKLDYLRSCLRKNPPAVEEAVRLEAGMTVLGDILQILIAAAKQ